MRRDHKTRPLSRMFLSSLLVLCLSPEVLLSQTQLANANDQRNASRTHSDSRVTLSQSAPTSRQPRPQHSFCSEQAWDYYFDNYADGNQSSPDVQQESEPVQSLSRVEEIPDERVESMPRVEEIPDERVQELPDERVQPMPRVGEDSQGED